MTKDAREWAECRYCTVQVLKKNLERHEKKCFTTYGIPTELQKGKRITTPQLIWRVSWGLALYSIIFYSIFLNLESFLILFVDLDFIFGSCLFFVVAILAYSIMNTIYFLWNTILTIIGIKYCVRLEKRSPTGQRFAFVRKKGSAEISEGWDGFVGWQIIFIIMCILSVAILAVILGFNQSIIIGIIPVLGLFFVLAFGYHIYQKGYSFQAESKFEATIYTIGIITAIVCSFVFLNYLFDLMSNYSMLAVSVLYLLLPIPIVFVIRKMEGGWAIGHRAQLFFTQILVFAYFLGFSLLQMQIKSYIHIVSAIALGIIVGVFRKHVIYSTRDMWISVFQGKQGEGSSSNIEITASNYSKNSSVENHARGIRRHYQNDDINSPSENLQSQVNPVNNSTPCPICSWNKSLDDIYCPNCGH